jgi:hypothetical protein
MWRFTGPVGADVSALLEPTLSGPIDNLQELILIRSAGTCIASQDRYLCSRQSGGN